MSNDPPPLLDYEPPLPPGLPDWLFVSALVAVGILLAGMIVWIHARLSAPPAPPAAAPATAPATSPGGVR